MLSNYLKIAFRHLFRHKAYSFLIVFGFALGLAVFILAILYTGFNFSYDTFHDGVKQIYGVVQVLPSGNKGEQHSAIVPAPLLPALAAEFTEIEESTRFSRCRRMIVRYGEKIFYESDVLLADPNFLEFFDFELIQGSRDRVLAEPLSIVLSADSALKYFGEADPLGKILTLDNKIDVFVSGIIENHPQNSSIRYDFLLSMETARLLFDWMDDWSANSLSAFVRLARGVSPGRLEPRLDNFIHKHFADSPETPERMYLFPLLEFRKKAEDMDLYSYLRWDEPFVVSYFFIGIALGLLLIVCINYMNLSTARYMQRAREIGMRKVVGARRFQLIKQFIGESIFLSLFSVPLAVVLYEILRPAYLSYTGLDIDISLWSYPWLALAFLGGTVLVGVFSGSYPAFFLSKFNAVHVLKGNIKVKNRGAALRKILVVSQFSLSILLIIFTIAISHQLRYLMKKDFGYDRMNTVVLSIPREVRSQMEPLKKELSRLPDVGRVSASRTLPVNTLPEGQILPEGFDETEAWTMAAYGIDYDFVEIFDLKLIEGRSFARDYQDRESFILNETAVEQLDWKEPLGKTLRMGKRTGMVIGVVKDFLFNNPHWEIGPTVLYLEQENLEYLFIKTTGGPVGSILEGVKTLWATFAPGIPFEYSTLEGRFETMNSYIEKMYVIIGIIGILAVLVSCMGLVALASHTVGSRTKEIGVRKVLGASVAGIVRMLLGNFVKLIVVSNIIAWPLTYVLLKQFLQWGWAYSTDISIASFVFSALLSLATAVFSVIYQTVKVAQSNPVIALKYE